MPNHEFTIAGGGLAGLTAAISLAQKGARVTLIEQSRTLGGRAGTERRDGFALNFGPHAMYCQGALAKALQAWNIPFSGKPARFGNKGFLVKGTQKFGLPIDAKSLLLTGAIGLTHKFDAARLLRAVQTAKHPVDPQHTLAQWLDQNVRAQSIRQLFEAFFRLGTYSNDPAHLSAAPALEQFRLGAAGVLYVDGGWATIAEALAAKARSLGVRILTGQPLHRAEPGMILAVPPASIERLTGAQLPPLRPVRAACLDIALRSLPDGAAWFGLGIDRPLYFSVHSAIASLAPSGHALIQIGRYLAPEEESPREELEEFADLLMPGWRRSVAFTRYLPNLTVAHALPTPQGRPAADSIPGVTLAGDWVGGEGMLADAAAASGLKAAELALQTSAAAA